MAISLEELSEDPKHFCIFYDTIRYSHEQISGEIIGPYLMNFESGTNYNDNIAYQERGGLSRFIVSSDKSREDIQRFFSVEGVNLEEVYEMVFLLIKTPEEEDSFIDDDYIDKMKNRFLIVFGELNSENNNEENGDEKW
ncbi:hypothetical protein COU57_03270 [Candidatus Pacearchaeota archaeon CG10_big_fil_rev_8_21_14_0_10_32_14]|nr:MAG: hypothetical protein COU57_03270 [Candidatus Pacearchaeota archaeon CG10_big_fil_rev_8_21_14_0_10_32_14]